MSAKYWVGKKSGSKEIKVSNKCLSQKKIRSKTICGPENVGPKNVGCKKMLVGPKKNCIQKMCGSQTKFASKEMLVGPNIVGPKKICVQIIFVSKE